MKSPDSNSGDTVACRNGREPSLADCANFMSICMPAPPPLSEVVPCSCGAARPGVALAHKMFVIPFSVSFSYTDS